MPEKGFKGENGASKGDH